MQEHVRTPAGVPPGKGLVVAFWAPEWCTARLKVDNETVSAATLEHLMPGITELVEFSAIDRWSPGNPDLHVGNHRLYARMDRGTDPRDRIALAGDYTGLPLIEGCVSRAGTQPIDSPALSWRDQSSGAPGSPVARRRHARRTAHPPRRPPAQPVQASRPDERHRHARSAHRPQITSPVAGLVT